MAATEKLNVNNYVNWCTDIKYVLLEKNLRDTIEKSKVTPKKCDKVQI